MNKTTVQSYFGYSVKACQVGLIFLALLTAVACSDPRDNRGSDCTVDVDCGINGACNQGECGCALGWDDCDGEADNGCEFEGVCACHVGETRSCYSGPSSTEGVGICTAGTQSCGVDGWSPCNGQVTPTAEDCEANQIDEDCDGVLDNETDMDGDGYSICDGDCCDSDLQHCADQPALVNPGALDFDGNDVDDDCDGIVDNPTPPDCSPQESLVDTTGVSLARALELCHTVDPDGRGFGLMAADLSTVGGTFSPDQIQTAVMESLGSIIPAVKNETMAILSSGRARGVGDPGFVSRDTNYASINGSMGESAPAEYLAQHTGQLETILGCPNGESLVHDSVRLRLQVRVPTNAQGFQFKFRFFSYEYPVYLCTEFNDFFLVQLNSQHPDIPADGNISFDADGNPVSINNAFFTTCNPLPCRPEGSDSTGPDSSMPPNMPGEGGDEEEPWASGVDADQDGCPDSLTCNTSSNVCENTNGACPDGYDDIAAYSVNTKMAGATSWLTTSAPVVPGELITLDFHIWDTSDQQLDSLVLIDDFEWLIEPTAVVTKQ